jgi:hypothetical protein
MELLLGILGFSLALVALQGFSLLMGALLALADFISTKLFNKPLL